MATNQAIAEAREMGRFSIEFDIANHEDIVGVRLGVVAAADVRRLRLHGVVDTGSTRLVLPASVVQSLGLPDAGETTVKFADGRRAHRRVVGDVQLQIGDRSSVFTAVVEPGRSDALIGAIVLEELDFLADCVTQQLVPRDPHGTITEVE
jgi:predicted aspartyl protease